MGGAILNLVGGGELWEGASLGREGAGAGADLREGAGAGIGGADLREGAGAGADLREGACAGIGGEGARRVGIREGIGAGIGIREGARREGELGDKKISLYSVQLFVTYCKIFLRKVWTKIVISSWQPLILLCI